MTDPEGLRAARRWSAWYLGDPDWADNIIHAYFTPDVTNRVLDEEIGDDT